MAKSIGKDIAGARILVNCVAPAVIETPMLADMAQEHAASLICFVASDELNCPSLPHDRGDVDDAPDLLVSITLLAARVATKRPFA